MLGKCQNVLCMQNKNVSLRQPKWYLVLKKNPSAAIAFQCYGTYSAWQGPPTVTKAQQRHL